MRRARPSFFTTHKRTIFALLFGLAFSATLAYAVPPGSQYTPGATLDPSCVPGSSNCSVSIATTWGSITGTLSAQTDLQTALNAKFDDPTGTTAQYIRGDGSLGIFNATGLIALQTNGVANGSQALLNLIAGNNVDLTDDGSGSVTIQADFPTVDTLYTADGVIIGSRTVDLEGNDLSFIDSGTGRVGITIDAAGLISNFGSNPIDGFAYIQVDNNSNLITLKAGTLNIPTGASDGYILTSDGTGNASWQAVSSGGSWGNITGTLSDQTDLQSAFDGKFDTPAGTTGQYIRGDGSLATFSPSGLALETNSIANGSQTLLNLIAGAGITLTDSGTGNVTLVATNPITVQNTSSLFSTGLSGGGSGSNATQSIFLGTNAGNSATGVDGSNFIGQNAGSGAVSVLYNNFFGKNAGLNASSTHNSNFIGQNAGSGAAGVNNSNFIGQNAGNSATGASLANFIGDVAGRNATNANNSNFLGLSAGENATNASQSNFLGQYAGQNATNALNGIFVGQNAGTGATNAANSILIGKRAGFNDTVNNTASYDDVSTFANTSILVGHSTSTGGFSNSIAIGAYATNTASNQFMIGSTTRPIDTTRINGSASTQCTITTGTGIACTSDERLKTDIADLPPSTLDTLLNVRTVTYHWLQNPASPEQIGFLAQDLEHYFPQLVATDSQGYKSVYYAQITPILVEAIREMNLKITDIGDLTKDNSWRTALLNWFASASNGITEFFAGEITTKTLCVADESGEKTCLTKGQLDSVLNNLGNTTIVMPMPAPEATSSEPAPTTESQPTLETSDTPESPAEFAPAPEVVSESSNTAPAE